MAEIYRSVLDTAQDLQGLILVMDIRHPLTEHDQTLLHWVNSRQLKAHILLNKADKLYQHAQPVPYYKCVKH